MSKDSVEDLGSSRGYAPPTEVAAWKCSDGRVFDDFGWADRHQKDLWSLRVANERLDAGDTIAECLRSAHYLGHIDPVFEKISKETKLVISHWQCKDIPGYQPCYFHLGLMDMHVAGDAGAWSGPWGTKVSLREIASYAEDPKTVFGA